MIIHVDMDAFYASVEIRDNPDLLGKPVVVGGSPTGRGVVCAASYEARKFGVHSAMPASEAIRRCPGAVFIKGRMSHYAIVSRQIREIFNQFTSLVEPLSLDEAFLDVTGCEKLFGDGPAIAAQIKQRIQSEVGLTASAGVAPNKYLAKIASDLEKPDGLVVVPPDSIQDFLDPLNVSRVWGIGPVTAARLTAIGVQTIHDLRQRSRAELKNVLGLNAEHFWRLARGLDTRPVVADRHAKSISHETTFANDIRDPDALLAWTLELTDQVGRRLRRNEIVGRTVKLKIRDQNFDTITRSSVMRVPDNTTEALWQTAKRMLEKVIAERPRPMRLVGVGVSDLSTPGKVQQNLFDRPEQEKSRKLDKTADLIRDKFGDLAVRRGTSVDHAIKFRRPVEGEQGS